MWEPSRWKLSSDNPLAESSKLLLGVFDGVWLSLLCPETSLLYVWPHTAADSCCPVDSWSEWNFKKWCETISVWLQNSCDSRTEMCQCWGDVLRLSVWDDEQQIAAATKAGRKWKRQWFLVDLNSSSICFIALLSSKNESSHWAPSAFYLETCSTRWRSAALQGSDPTRAMSSEALNMNPSAKGDKERTVWSQLGFLTLVKELFLVRHSEKDKSPTPIPN